MKNIYIYIYKFRAHTFCSASSMVLLPLLSKLYSLAVSVHWPVDKVLTLQKPRRAEQQLPGQIADRLSSPAVIGRVLHFVQRGTN